MDQQRKAQLPSIKRCCGLQVVAAEAELINGHRGLSGRAPFDISLCYAAESAQSWPLASPSDASGSGRSSPGKDPHGSSYAGKGGKLLDCAGNRAAVLKTGSEARGARAPRVLNFWKGPKGELLGSPSPKRNGASRAPGANYDEGGESRRCCRFLKSPRGDAPREPREGWSGSTWTTKEV